MDDAGIDVQILSHAPPGPQRLDGETAVRVSKAANDRLYEICRNHSDRFAGFAMLPTPDPKAAADELERTVNSLGFKGRAGIRRITHGSPSRVTKQRQKR